VVEPAEELALEQDAVLRLTDPVVLIGEDKHPRRDTAQLGGVERHHTLRCQDAVVLLAMGDHNGGVPPVHKAMG